MNLDRRTAIQWMLAASAALRAPTIAFADDVAKTIAANGYGKDPNLIKSYASGELWPLTLTSDQRKIASALSDTIIPPEGNQPGAAGVGVVDFIDEWISAPYPDNVRDRPLILEGLAWLDERARAKYKTGFASSSDQQRASLCDELVGTTVPAALQKPAAFFARYRDLTAVGFYTTPIGTQDLGYRGNVPLDRYDGPPKEALAKLGLG